MTNEELIRQVIDERNLDNPPEGLDVRSYLLGTLDRDPIKFYIQGINAARAQITQLRGDILTITDIDSMTALTILDERLANIIKKSEET
jgi:hypothetical protein